MAKLNADIRVYPTVDVDIFDGATSFDFETYPYPSSKSKAKPKPKPRNFLKLKLKLKLLKQTYLSPICQYLSKSSSFPKHLPSQRLFLSRPYLLYPSPWILIPTDVQGLFAMHCTRYRAQKIAPLRKSHQN